MKIFDRLMLAIYSFFLAVISFIIILLPFDFSFLSIGNVIDVVYSVKGNYLYSLLGLVLLFISLRFLFSGLNNKDNLQGSFLVMRNEYGEILVYEETIIGLCQYVVNKFTGIKNVKTNVNFIEGQVNLILRGEVSSELNIPEASRDLQAKVKEHIENTTGAPVGEIKMEIVNVSGTNTRVK